MDSHRERHRERRLKYLFGDRAPLSAAHRTCTHCHRSFVWTGVDAGGVALPSKLLCSRCRTSSSLAALRAERRAHLQQREQNEVEIAVARFQQQVHQQRQQQLQLPAQQSARSRKRRWSESKEQEVQEVHGDAVSTNADDNDGANAAKVADRTDERLHRSFNEWLAQPQARLRSSHLIGDHLTVYVRWSTRKAFALDVLDALDTASVNRSAPASSESKVPVVPVVPLVPTVDLATFVIEDAKWRRRGLARSFIRHVLWTLGETRIRHQPHRQCAQVYIENVCSPDWRDKLSRDHGFRLEPIVSPRVMAGLSEEQQRALRASLGEFEATTPRSMYLPL